VVEDALVKLAWLRNNVDDFAVEKFVSGKFGVVYLVRGWPYEGQGVVYYVSVEGYEAFDVFSTWGEAVRRFREQRELL
jgi:hypothetical protein